MAGHNVNYGAGSVNLTAGARMNDGYVVRGPGPQNVAPVTPADSIAVTNFSNTWVRGTITINPLFTGTTTGNTSFVISPGGTFQETFAVPAIESIEFDAVDIPPGPGTNDVTLLPPNPEDYILGVKFLEA